MKKKLNQYSVMVKVVLETEVEVSAESLVDALEKTKDLTVVDVVDFKTPHNDSEIKVTGVFAQG